MLSDFFKIETSFLQFHEREDAILYAACFDANAGVFEVMTGQILDFF